MRSYRKTYYDSVKVFRLHLQRRKNGSYDYRYIVRLEITARSFFRVRRLNNSRTLPYYKTYSQLQNISV